MYTFGLIGFPISGSLSPWIHARFLREINQKGKYELFEVSSEEDLEHTLHSLMAKGMNGCNVTVPYKETILPFIDHVDKDAKRIGAINTIVIKDGKTYGYNTDGKGYVRSLETRYPQIFNKSLRVLILGAGGAARGIYSALMNENCTEISIANRTSSSAKEITQMNNTKITSSVLSLEEAEKKLASYDLVIQTTSVGMKPNDKEMIISLENIQKETVVSDIVYQPIETQILKEAKLRHCQIHYGHTMLLYQAQYAFELWTKERPQIGLMDKELQQILEGKQMLTGKQKRFLRSKANTLRPIFQVGKAGVNDNMNEQINEALEKRELIKISILQNCLEDKDTIAEEIAAGTDCTIVQIIGNNIVIYKESVDNKTIILPQ